MAQKPEKLQKIEFLNELTDSFIVNREGGVAQLPASQFAKNFTADKFLMPDGVTSIAEYYRSFSNQNLLDNWYFANPVNQRGQTEYTNVNYTIDRWRTYTSVITTLFPDGIRVDASANDYRSIFSQRIGHFKELEGKTVTLSALAKLVSGSYFTLSYGTTYDSNITEQAGYYKNTEYEVVSFTFAIPNGMQDHFNVSITPGNKGIVDVAAMKLELGHRQTLAHKENGVWVLNEVPNYATELTKCQRYQVVIRLPTWSNFPASGATGTTQNGLRVAFTIPATMQKNPTVSFEGEIYANFLKSGKIESVLIKSCVWAILDTPMSVRLALDATPTDTVYPVLSISTRDSTAKIILDSNI